MKLAAFIFLSLLLLACQSAAPPVVNSTKPINAAQQTNEAQSVLAHSTENQPRKPSNSGGTDSGKSASGDPIDTSSLDATIREAEKEMKAHPLDGEVKKGLAEAYFARGFALTEARQYAAALGDYRRALKYDPSDGESKKWVDQIIGIYAGMKREAPKEGQEPPPLPFKKEG